MPRKTVRKSKNGYNKQPAMSIFVKDWLTNSKLKMAGMCAKGFWIDFLFITHTVKGDKDYGIFNYGRLENEVKILLDTLLVQKSTMLVPEALKILQEKIKTQHEFLEATSAIMGYRAEEICNILPRLLYFDVAKINEHGLLYSSRMVRDSEISRIRAAAGSKGGQTTQKKRVEKMPPAAATEEKFSENGNGVHHETIPENNITINNNIKNGDGENFATVFEQQIPAYANPVLYVFKDRGVGKENFEAKLPKAIATVMNKSYEEFAALGKSVAAGVTQEDFSLWKEFVTYLADPENRMARMLSCDFVFPKDFKIIVEKGFKRARWKRVCGRLLSSGLKPEQSLFFRIPDALRWKYDDITDSERREEILEENNRVTKMRLETLENQFKNGEYTQREYDFYVQGVLKGESSMCLRWDYKSMIRSEELAAAKTEPGQG